MKRTRLIAAIFVVSAFGTLPVVSAGSFHAPATAPEKALDKILHLADADEDQLANLLHRPGSDGRVDYTQMLTPALIAALRNEEKKLVRKECGGKYLDGEECGFDYSPITCAQDSEPSYIYHTILEFDAKAVIEYAWPNQPSSAATYTVVKGKSGWLIDGVTCATGPKFN
jgi:hypothetical protein